MVRRQSCADPARSQFYMRAYDRLDAWCLLGGHTLTSRPVLSARCGAARDAVAAAARRPWRLDGATDRCARPGRPEAHLRHLYDRPRSPRRQRAYGAIPLAAPRSSLRPHSTNDHAASATCRLICARRRIFPEPIVSRERLLLWTDRAAGGPNWYAPHGRTTATGARALQVTLFRVRRAASSAYRWRQTSVARPRVSPLVSRKNSRS